VIDAIPTTSPTYALAPTTDFFGNPRPDAPGSAIDIGAVEVVGTGNAVSVSPSSLDFPNQIVNPLNTPLPLLVTLTNYTSATVAIVSYVTSGPNASEFSPTLNNCSASRVPANGSCSIFVRFRPTAVGDRTAILTITLGNGQPPLVVILNGTGTAPVGSLSTSTVNFPSTKVGTTAGPTIVTLTNTGGGLLNGLTYTITGANPTNFAEQYNCSGGQLAPGATCSIFVRFTPNAVGARSATLTVHYSSPVTVPATVVSLPITLTGTGR
jgi:hypothetical protein